MANLIITEKKIKAVSAILRVSCPILRMANRKLESTFADGNSDTVNMSINGYGTTYQTNDLTGKLSDINSLTVPLRVLQYRKGFSLSKISEMFDVNDKANSIVKPFCGEFAYTINQVYANTALFAANTAVVATSPTFAMLSGAIANVDETLMSGMTNGMLGITMQALITNSGISQFGNSALAKELYQNMIGNYNGVEFTKMPTPLITTAGIFPAGTMTITTAVDAFGVGTTTALFTATSAPGAAITIKAGTAIKLANVGAVGEMARETGKDRVLIVQSDTTIPTTANTTPVAIPVGTVYFSGPKKNVNVSAISGVAVTNLMEANTKYMTGAVWNENDLMIAVKAPAPFASLDSMSVGPTDGLPIRMSVESYGLLSIESSYMDLLSGAAAYTGRSTCAIFLKVT